MIEKLLELRWWDWPLDRIKRNRRFFETDLSKISASDVDELLEP